MEPIIIGIACIQAAQASAALTAIAADRVIIESQDIRPQLDDLPSLDIICCDDYPIRFLILEKPKGNTKPLLLPLSRKQGKTPKYYLHYDDY